MAGVLRNVQAAMAQIEELEGSASGALAASRKSSFLLARGHVAYQFEHFSQIYEGEFRPVNIRVAANVIKGDKVLIRKHASSAARYAEDVKQHIQRQIGVGIIKGESIDQLTSRLMGLGPVLDLAKEITPDGIARGLLSFPRAQANRLVRTEVISAYNNYHLDTMKDLSQQIDEPVFKRWDSSLDARGCDECQGLDGEVQPEGEEFSNGSQQPPAHPNCRCTVVPWMKSWGKMEGQDKGTGSIDAPATEPGL
jgi:SPP1 gp7 family putative phage head morphogenesis protein